MLEIHTPKPCPAGNHVPAARRFLRLSHNTWWAEQLCQTAVLWAQPSLRCSQECRGRERPARNIPRKELPGTTWENLQSCPFPLSSSAKLEYKVEVERADIRNSREALRAQHMQQPWVLLQPWAKLRSWIAWSCNHPNFGLIINLQDITCISAALICPKPSNKPRHAIRLVSDLKCKWGLTSGMRQQPLAGPPPRQAEEV